MLTKLWRLLCRHEWHSYYTGIGSIGQTFKPKKQERCTKYGKVRRVKV